MISSIHSLIQTTQQGSSNKVDTQIKDFQDILNSTTLTPEQEELKEACIEIEHYFLSNIMKQMVASTQSENALIPKGDYELMVEDSLIDEQCRALCESGGIGIADVMYKQMLKDL